METASLRHTEHCTTRTYGYLPHGFWYHYGLHVRTHFAVYPHADSLDAFRVWGGRNMSTPYVRIDTLRTDAAPML
jgi:hypothetical protein